MALTVILEPLGDKVGITAFDGTGVYVDCVVDNVKVRPSHRVGGYKIVGTFRAVKVVAIDCVSSVRYHDGKGWTEVRAGKTIASRRVPSNSKIDMGAD